MVSESEPLTAPVDDLWRLTSWRATETPSARMLVDESGRSLTFSEYGLAAAGVAAWLGSVGVSHDSVVAWQLPTCIESFVLMAALARLGAVQVPIVPIYRDAEVDFILRHVGSDFIVAAEMDGTFDHVAMAWRVTAETSCSVIVGDVRQRVSGTGLRIAEPSRLPPYDAGAAGIRWTFFTSGTTADPKGVRHTDSSVIAGSAGLRAAMRLVPADVVSMTFPVAHIGGPQFLAAQLMSGCQAVIARGFDVEATPALLAREGVTVIRGPQQVIRACVDAQLAAGEQPLYPALRACQTGGASRSAELHQVVRDVLRVSGLVGGYSMTECPGITCADPDADADLLLRTEGLPSTGVEIVIADPDDQALPRTQSGHVLVRGPNLFSGYVDTSLDALAFTSDGLFRTGDLGHLTTDGYLSITGRIKDIIVRKGEKISAAELEAVLRRHTSVADVALVAMPDATTGERACACVELVAGALDLSIRDVVRHFESNRMARQKIPEQIVIFECLPRTATGKVLKAVLREQVETVMRKNGESVVAK